MHAVRCAFVLCARLQNDQTNRFDAPDVGMPDAPSRLSSRCAHFCAFITVNCYICGEMVQSMITLSDADYVPQRWQQTLLTIAFVVGIGSHAVHSIFSVSGLIVMHRSFQYLCSSMARVH